MCGAASALWCLALLLATAQAYLPARPMLAVLKGVQPHEVCDIAEALAGAGFNSVAVPVDDPLFRQCLSALVAHPPQGIAATGAADITTPMQACAAAAAGACFLTSNAPHAGIMRTATALGMTALGGIARAADARAMLRCGADALMLLPAADANASVAREVVMAAAAACAQAAASAADADALHGVGGAAALKPAAVLAAGGLEPHMLPELVQAGVSGFAVGTAIYQPGDAPEFAARRAAAFAAAAAATPAPALRRGVFAAAGRSSVAV